ncbi:MAG: SDR family oxidoreductase [Gammaproteobacteria bacterium]|nr:SDR family oxidoreductase [Gammaproteobacteria bacterium]MCY4217695.1 SDR family oxidoreductase [Gammaproteobacteria bacterium]MCY4275052.1 SDR family oxidoreductase [Gammaproteobacteria bacterium]
MNSNPAQPLYGRIAVVTGGCGGIGQAICKRLIREGATVYALDLAEPTYSDVKYLKHDVTCEQSAIDLAKHIQSHHDRFDILINAAGIEIEKTIEETTLDEWNRIFAINVSGTFLTSKYALPLMRKTGGSIVNFGSYDGFIADPKLAAYCATKGAVHALTRAMACDHGPENIRVNAVCPGFIDTPMLQSFFGEGSDSDRYYQAARDVHPIHRYGTPEDVANLVFWLASDESSYATGQLWVLDGGLTAQVQQMRV